MNPPFLIPLLFAVMTGMSFRAVAQSIADQAGSAESQQKDVQVNTHALVDEVDSMIDEYQRNGLHGDDINNLKSLRGILAKLSEKDMARILVLLQQAGAQNDPAAALKVIAAAYSEQKGVLVEMKQILASFASEQEALELSNEAKDLADRQAANLQTGIESAQYASSHEDQAPLAASVQGQAAEQKAIGDEMTILQTKIETFAKDPSNQALAERFNRGTDEATKITPVLGSATDSLDQSRLFEAVTSEKDGRDKLRQLAHTLAPPQDPADALREAAEQLDKIISQQKDVISTTDASIAMPIQDYISDAFKDKEQNGLYQFAKKCGWLSLPADKLAGLQQIQNIYNQYKSGKVSTSDDLENEEGDLVSQTDFLIQDIEELAKPAADALSAAIPPMQAVRSSLTDRDTTKAAPPEKDALANMERARDLLLAQLAEAEREDEKTGDPITDLEEAQKEVQALMQEQNTVDQATAAPKTPQQAAADAQEQSQIQAKTQQLQQQTADQAPAASQSLSNAAANMQQAAGAIPNPAQAAQAQRQQGAAMQNLANANNQLQQQIAELQQIAQQLAEAQKEIEALEKLIEREQKLQADTTRAAAQQAKERAVIVALAPVQHGIQDDTNEFAKTLGADPQQPNADTRMKTAASASAHMGDAQGQLEKGEATAANPGETQALDDLYKLRDDLNAQIQAQEAQLSQPDPQGDQANSDAAAAVAQAQADLAQAQSQMNQNADAQAASQLNQAQAAVANAAAQANNMPQGAEPAMRDAANALAAAEAQAATGNTPQAQAAGQQAGHALAQAAAALAQSQAGIAAAGTPGNMPSNTPGNTPGSKPGKIPGKHGNTQITGAAQSSGAATVVGSHLFLGLPKRDRTAIQEAQSEKYPPQYAEKIEQYMENVANDGARQ